jgi:multidrug efflux pump subunit AcrB
VNDALLLVNFVNEKRRQSMELHHAVMAAAQRRFRPIVLTSLTTSLGLTPIILEKSMQAQFLIPMAISLGFGILFATFITLLIVPSLYLILEDFLRLFRTESGVKRRKTVVSS